MQLNLLFGKTPPIINPKFSSSRELNQPVFLVNSTDSFSKLKNPSQPQNPFAIHFGNLNVEQREERLKTIFLELYHSEEFAELKIAYEQAKNEKSKDDAFIDIVIEIEDKLNKQIGKYQDLLTPGKKKILFDASDANSWVNDTSEDVSEATFLGAFLAVDDMGLVSITDNISKPKCGYGQEYFNLNEWLAQVLLDNFNYLKSQTDLSELTLPSMSGIARGVGIPVQIVDRVLRQYFSDCINLDLLKKTLNLEALPEKISRTIGFTPEMLWQEGLPTIHSGSMKDKASQICESLLGALFRYKDLYMPDSTNQYVISVGKCFPSIDRNIIGYVFPIVEARYPGLLTLAGRLGNYVNFDKLT